MRIDFERKCADRSVAAFSFGKLVREWPQLRENRSRNKAFILASVLPVPHAGTSDCCCFARLLLFQEHSRPADIAELTDTGRRAQQARQKNDLWAQ
jgi:hypothetical protein